MSNAILLIDEIQLTSATALALPKTTFSSTTTFAAGTNAVAPAIMTSGTNLTSAIAGAKEYDGTCFYNTPVTSNRGVNVTEHFIYQTGTYSQGNVNTAIAMFNAVANGTITLPATTLFEFEILWIGTSTGSGSRNLSVLFPCSSAPTAINYTVIANNLGATGYTTINSCQTVLGSVTTAVVVTGTIAANAFTTLFIKGTIATNGATTLIPQVKWSTAPGTSTTVQIGSYMKMHALGSNAAVSCGNWS